jgi:hypothetical protein
MYRVKNRRNVWRTRWPWKKFFPPKVDERFCEKCGLIYQYGPMPKPVREFMAGNVTALVFPAGSWRKRELTITFGRWKAPTRQFYLSHYFTHDELRELMAVAVQTDRYLKAINLQPKVRADRSRHRVV